MNIRPAHAWLDFANGVCELDWNRAAHAIIDAPALPIEALVELDLIRPAIFGGALHGPPALAEVLRQKIVPCRGRFFANDGTWTQDLVESVFYKTVEAYVAALSHRGWQDSTRQFKRLVTIPRLAFAQDVLIEQLSRDLVDIAEQTEASLSLRIRNEDDLGRLGLRTEKRLKRLSGSWRLRLIAEALQHLNASRQYAHISASILLRALTRLAWPTLRHFGWLAQAPLPCATDRRWDAVLVRPIVRAVTAPPDFEDTFFYEP